MHVREMRAAGLKKIEPAGRNPKTQDRRVT